MAAQLGSNGTNSVGGLREMKFCPNCGNKLKENDSKCPKCGFELSKAKLQDNKLDGVKQKFNLKNIDLKNFDLRKNGSKTDKVNVQQFFGQHKKIVWAICALIAIILIYTQVYVPHVVNSALENNGFTSAKGYKVNVNRMHKIITLKSNYAHEKQFNEQLRANGFDTRQLPVENQMSNVAHEIAGRTLGTWTIEMSTGEDLHTGNGKFGSFWVFKGTKETKRFQTTPVGRQCRNEYLERQREQADDEAQQQKDDLIGAGAIGFMLGAL